VLSVPTPGVGSEVLRCTPVPAEVEIVLTDSPFCGFFVVLAKHGYPLVSWEGGYEIFSEGDLLRGDFNCPGTKEVDLVMPAKL
jgi:hypothetical protein